jgi:hypothetical protein
MIHEAFADILQILVMELNHLAHKCLLLYSNSVFLLSLFAAGSILSLLDQCCPLICNMLRKTVNSLREFLVDAAFYLIDILTQKTCFLSPWFCKQ